ncbi:Pleiotropic drug resistance protein 2 [Linum perenne]
MAARRVANDDDVSTTSTSSAASDSEMEEGTSESGRGGDVEEDVRWRAIERLPTWKRVRKGMMHGGGGGGGAAVVPVEVDVRKMELRDKILLLENLLKGVLEFIGLCSSKKKVVKILQDVSGTVKPSRLTLLLGPPGSGKTTLLKALAGKLDKNLKVSGKITYCGHEFSEFVPQRTSAYISQHDLHYGEMTVRETLEFSRRCLGVGSRQLMLEELLRREKSAGIVPDFNVDAFMKATTVASQRATLFTDYVLKILGLDICADTVVGDDMRRGISGGQKKRVTTGEMLTGPAKVFFMDEISTGLDSSTTYNIINFLKQIAHIMGETIVVSLLQPSPETFNLFDDIILLAESQIVYRGPKSQILQFFQSQGFECPDRKSVPDFIQEVTSKKDQFRYWVNQTRPYRFIPVPDFAKRVGSPEPEFEKSETHPAALERSRYAISKWDLLTACFEREWLWMKRNSIVFVFKTVQIGVMAVIASTVFLRSEMDPGEVGGVAKYGGALFFSLNNVLFNGLPEIAMTTMKLPVFFKQRDLLFYPAWVFALPIWVLSVPVSVVESGILTGITYYSIGFAPDATRFLKQFLALFGIHQMSMSLYHFTGVLGRIEVIATTIATFALLIFFLLGGYIVAKYDIASWMRWCYYLSPVMYGQNAIAINEFLDERWNVPTGNASVPTIGMAFLNQKGMFTTEKWYWISMVALFGFTIFFNLIFILALKYLKPLGDNKVMVVDKEEEALPLVSNLEEGKSKSQGSDEYNEQSRKGMVLPFQPLSLVFNHVNYYVDMPSEMKSQEHGKNTRLQLLHDVSGAFRPCVLTALVGASGAGKTTLMDVLAGRKTGGYIEGSITISGYPKNQQTFARVSGYCEQNDIHSPYVTVYESLIFSAWLRLSSDISEETRKMFVEEVMELIELNPIRDALVGHPGVDGLSTEQRKRLTIAVELVANPSIIFMDEPTSGLDARAAAIVMRTVRNTVDTGRTVVCTIHQPSTDIFEAFDEASSQHINLHLLLMKRGGRVIYAGPLGHHSSDLVSYFEGIIGVEKIREGYNPAAWMLEVTSTSVEAKLGIDYAELYTNSDLYKRNDELIKELGAPTPESENLHFPTRFSQGFFIQCKACFWKQHWSYWRNSQYNAIRFYVTIVIGLLFGIVFWSKGDEIHKEQDLLNLLGATYAAVLFLGASNAAAIQPVVSMERTVFYRERAAGMYSALPYAFAQEIPLWWRWYYWLCPLAWTIKGAFTSQFGDLNHLIEVSMSDPIPVDVFLEENFGYHSHSLGSVVLAHVGWVFLFIFVFAYSIKFLNFQKR